MLQKSIEPMNPLMDLPMKIVVRVAVTALACIQIDCSTCRHNSIEVTITIQSPTFAYTEIDQSDILI